MVSLDDTYDELSTFFQNIHPPPFYFSFFFVIYYRNKNGRFESLSIRVYSPAGLVINIDY